MKTINKKELHNLFMSYDEWFYKSPDEINYHVLWERTYSMAHGIEENINKYSNGELYRIIYGLKNLNENVTFEQIVKCLEVTGFEVK